MALLLLGAVEWYLSVSLRVFERRGVAEVTAPTWETPAPLNFYSLGSGDPARFCERLRERVGNDVIVFVGDSQGVSARDHGPGYPQIVAQRLADAGARTSVVSLHVGGGNAYEQGLLLLTILRAGIVPRAVFWSHSVFSQRKNEIRNEYAAAWRDAGGAVSRLAPGLRVPVLASPTPARRDPARQAYASLSAGWADLIDRFAVVRFMRRPLWDKGEILRRSPLPRLLPASLRPGTARQFDPPSSILRASASFVGGVSALIRERGARVVHFVAPINRAASPRPFATRAEILCYPALRRAAEESGGEFVNLLDSMPPERFGSYADGTPDAFHLDEAGHAQLATRFMELLAGSPPEAAR